MEGRAKGSSGTGGKLNGSVCVHKCVRALAKQGPGTTRIDILFERKHNKTHWNMVQEEQGVILKVNKQKRRVAEVPFLLSSQQWGKLGLQGSG